MEKVKNENAQTPIGQGIQCHSESDSIPENGRKLVSLIVKIIVNTTLRECYEKKGNTVSEIQ